MTKKMTLMERVADILKVWGILVVCFIIVGGTFWFTQQQLKPITPEQAQQINEWLFDQPSISEAIDMVSKDGKISNEEYDKIENAYQAAVAKEKLPRIIR